MQSPPSGALFLTGPTGSGKSAVAMCLAEQLGMDIVCGDAYQIYRGMGILTAQPSPEDMARVPHRLYGCVEPAEDSDVAKYNLLARKEIANAAAHGRTALVTGGSGLYIKVLTHGLAPVPPSDPALREKLEQLTTEELALRLMDLDPESAARLNLRNARHVLRALEITMITGTPASELKQTWQAAPPPACGVYLQRDRDDLRRRIRARTAAMFRSGLLAEVEALEEVPLSATAQKAIGLREALAVLDGSLSQVEAEESIATATSQYAKRQDTWFRRETCLITLHVDEKETPERTAERVRKVTAGMRI